MNFLINETVCGIEIKAADFDDHDGRWKCHLADTDVNAQIKSEAYTEINVMTFLRTHLSKNRLIKKLASAFLYTYTNPTNLKRPSFFELHFL